MRTLGGTFLLQKCHGIRQQGLDRTGPVDFQIQLSTSAYPRLGVPGYGRNLECPDFRSSHVAHHATQGQEAWRDVGIAPPYLVDGQISLNVEQNSVLTIRPAFDKVASCVHCQTCGTWKRHSGRNRMKAPNPFHRASTGKPASAPHVKRYVTQSGRHHHSQSRGYCRDSRHTERAVLALDGRGYWPRI